MCSESLSGAQRGLLHHVGDMLRNDAGILWICDHLAGGGHWLLVESMRADRRVLCIGWRLRDDDRGGMRISALVARCRYELLADPLCGDRGVLRSHRYLHRRDAGCVRPSEHLAGCGHELLAESLCGHRLVLCPGR